MKKKLINFVYNSISENSPVGYILEEDLKYPDELHDSHSNYPLAPESVQICCLSIVVKLLINMKNELVG